MLPNIKIEALVVAAEAIVGVVAAAEGLAMVRVGLATLGRAAGQVTDSAVTGTAVVVDHRTVLRPRTIVVHRVATDESVRTSR